MRGALGVAAAVVVGLIAAAGGYGYHRDELYFLAAGDHLAWGYPDQGPLTPAIAALMDVLAPDSLRALRVPPALMTGGVVAVAALIARELGGSSRAQLIAAACTAVGAVFLITGHLLSTTTFDVLAWAVVTWLVVRAVLRDEPRLWLAAGAVLGLGLLNKPLPAFLVFALLAGVAIAGPRRLLRDPWVWAGALLALALWSPWLVWQAGEGWPQLEVASGLAEGGSTSSEPRWAFLPFQLLLVSPMLAPVWIAGLVRLLRDERLRFLGWAWIVLAAAFLLTGGKPYYMAGLFPLLLGAGALSVDAWLDRGRRTARRVALGAAIGGSLAVGAILALPILPVGSMDPVLALNEDAGETVGWPAFARAVARVHQPGDTILTTNYGEAGAIDRYGPAPAYSGHNGYHDWGPPPEGARTTVVVAQRPPSGLTGCRPAARIDSRVDNEEDGTPVWRCTGRAAPWAELWPAFRALG